MLQAGIDALQAMIIGFIPIIIIVIVVKKFKTGV